MRQLKLYFHTSSESKFQHLRYLFSQHGLALYRALTFKGSYPELQDTAKKSLKLGAEFLQRRLRAPFIIEDTELQIEAYSQHFPYPGYDLKRWWKATTFEEIDYRCRVAGTRAAVSFSHICLSIPGLDLAFFTGSTEGTLATEWHHFTSNPATPWLNDQDVGAIFIPKGANKPLGSMDLQESLPYDFRYRCVKALIGRINMINTILNLDPSCYQILDDNEVSGSQLRLFE